MTLTITDRDRTIPLIGKDNRGWKGDPNSVEGRLKREGIKVPASTIRGRMSRYNCTFEEAVAMTPATKRECGHKGRAASPWRKD